MNLTAEEQALLESVENDEWQSVPDFETRKKQYRSYAEATLKKDRRINIRLSSRDLDALQARALEEGIPYQTLIASILHKYVSGSLYDVTAIRPSH